MKRKAFILTEILTSMTLQAIFAITLCAAFYMLLSFSTSTQQVIAAHDDGDTVITYIDSRIRNAGLGLWKSRSHRAGQDVTGVNAVFKANENFGVINQYSGVEMNSNKRRATDILPVAIVSFSDKGEGLKVSCDAEAKIFEGNILTLLYAHQDTENERLVLREANDTLLDESVKVNQTSIGNSKEFRFIEAVDTNDVLSTKSNFVYSYNDNGSINNYANIKSWAVMEASGLPVRLSKKTGQTQWKVYINNPYCDVNIYPVSELLNLECERIYTAKSTDEYSLMISTLGHEGSAAIWNPALPHSKNILELHMILDTNKTIPVFTLEILVSEGKNSAGDTPRPSEWPEVYWKDDFAYHKVHISRASWKLYNLAPLFN